MTEMEATKEAAADHGEEVEEEGPPPGWESAILLPPQPQPPPRPHPSTTTANTASAAAAAGTESAAASPGTSEMAQMVCGSCRRLLSYPQGSKHVQCSCCQTVNLVLEAHQVGQVKCNGCSVLLIYPYGASSVRCSSCRSVTEIGDHNKRPPWSVQQGQPRAFRTVQ